MNKYFLVLIAITFGYISTSFTLTKKEIARILYLNSKIPLDTKYRKRVITTIFCQDCSYIPKVNNAGKLFHDENFNVDYQLMHNGLKVIKDGYYGNWMTLIIEKLRGHHEPQEEKYFYEILKYIPNNPVMIELGSYWGYYSMWMKKDIPTAKNYLIEPDPKNIIMGEKNFRLNNISGTFVQAMVDSVSAKNQKFVDPKHNEYIVDAISIDDFAKKENIKFIHMLHSDIQGAELPMLKGCRKLMAQKRIGYYFISTHRTHIHDKCLEILRANGLKILVSINMRETFSEDGLIVAKLPELPSGNIKVSYRTNEFSQYLKKISI